MNNGLENKRIRRAASAITLLALLSSMLWITLRARGAATEAVLPAGKSFVYTILNPDGANVIAAYERDPETGALVFRGTYATGGAGTGVLVDSQSPLVVNEAGTFLYAINPGSGDVSVMAIREDGSLAAVGQPVPSRGAEPASLALSGDLLYVANQGNTTTPPSYTGFRVLADGTLASIKRRVELNIGDNLTHILFNKTGDMLFGMRLGGRGIDRFRVIRENGKLKGLSQLNNQNGPFAGVFNPANPDHLVVADARLPGAASYLSVGREPLVRLSGVSNAPERAACWIVAHQNGTHYWVANTGTHSVSLYTLDANGTLSLVSSHSTLFAGRLPFEVVLDKANRFLYELNTASGNQSIHVMRLTGGTTSAGLEDASTAVIPAGSQPIGLVIVE
jgi:6-phosphogluconolactonase